MVDLGYLCKKTKGDIYKDSITVKQRWNCQ